ncbi:MAG: 4-(cytidine 5'-diphospho)-2-C-methyl-D-erythritol kinase [Arenicella sp.]|jgi:4-diphosphocytidyl-2-C-methyl-D-erythritol kinase|nr:4-(cytidine 5'-diphospho)-2-C-methyl-D-erythritol kinase [Arenicella sp.]
MPSNNPDLPIWLAPAKINLFLHVVGKRSDGYHELQTIFQFLDFADEMSFSVNLDGELERSYDFGFNRASDLNLRAAATLRDFVGKPELGTIINLDKKIPMGGGLGGGSSNAATTLIALNHLWGLALDKKTLQELGLSLGADVPVFVAGHSAWAEGIGEILTPISLPTPWYLVLFPDEGVSTNEIFSQNQLTGRAQMKKIRALRNQSVLSVGENDLEPIVRRLVPEVDYLICWMEKFGKVRMTGSGSSVFMPCDSERKANELLARRPESIQGFVAKGINKIERLV